MSLTGKSVSEIRKLLQAKDVSAKEILQSHFDHIEKSEENIAAFTCLTKELAFAQAQSIDKLITRGENLPALAGVPVALKDNLCLPDYPTTCSSKILENFVPFYYSTAVKKLFDSGAICLGKTNLDEFAMGSSTENSAFKLTRNPWNTKCVPGGSSGGSCAAVAAGFAPIALGSDTGGSVRQPASVCGIVGMKPTYGLVSRFGLVAFASSLDQIGPIAQSVEDAARTLAVIAGHDPKDSTSLSDKDINLSQFDALLGTLNESRALAKVKIGVIEELTGEGNEPEVKRAIEEACKTFVALGAQVDYVSLPRAKNALAVYYILATAEASSNLARFDGVKYGYRDETSKDILNMYNSSRQTGFGAEVKRRIMLGTYVLSSGYYDAYYKKAQQVRRLLAQDFQKLLALMIF